MSLRVAIYCRVSSDRQREQGTIGSQREALLVHAQSQGWNVVRMEEDDGVSGEVPPWDRPAMSRVLGLVEARAIDLLLVIDVDRIARDEDNVAFSMVRKALRDTGVKLATPRGFLDLESAEQRLFQDILSALASFERHKIKERTTRGRRAAILHGEIRPVNRLPTGYAWDAEAKRVVVDEEDAALVREIFRLATEEKKGLQAIVRDLARRGIRSRRTYRGEPIYLVHYTVRAILQNPAYHTGRYNPGFDWAPDLTVAVPTLVTTEVWSLAQALYGRASARNAHKADYPYLLRGVVRCAGCRRAMRGHTVGERNAYYRCVTVDRPHPNAEPCPCRGSVRADAVDARVWTFLRDLLAKPGALQAEVERTLDAEVQADQPAETVLSGIDAELRALDQSRARIIRLCRDSLITEDEARAELQDLDQKRRPLLTRRELVTLRQKDRSEMIARLALIQSTLADVTARIDTLDHDGRRALVEALVEEVTLDPRTRQISVRCALIEPPDPSVPPSGPSGHLPPLRGGRKGRSSQSGSYADLDSPRPSNQATCPPALTPPQIAAGSTTGTARARSAPPAAPRSATSPPGAHAAGAGSGRACSPRRPGPRSGLRRLQRHPARPARAPGCRPG